MGCAGYKELNTDYFLLYKNMIIISDYKDIINNFEVYLISTESIPNLIKLVEESKILENKNEQNEKLLSIYQRNLFEKFKHYELDKNIKIYNDFTLCKDLAGGYNEKDNSFIIVDKLFLLKMRVGYNEFNKYVLMNYDKKMKIKTIFFPNEDLYLNFDCIKTGIYKFIIPMNDSDENIEKSACNNKEKKIINNNVEDIINNKVNNNCNNNFFSQSIPSQNNTNLSKDQNISDEPKKLINPKIINSNNIINNDNNPNLNFQVNNQINNKLEEGNINGNMNLNLNNNDKINFIQDKFNINQNINNSKDVSNLSEEIQLKNDINNNINMGNSFNNNNPQHFNEQNNINNNFNNDFNKPNVNFNNPNNMNNNNFNFPNNNSNMNINNNIIMNMNNINISQNNNNNINNNMFKNDNNHFIMNNNIPENMNNLQNLQNNQLQVINNNNNFINGNIDNQNNLMNPLISNNNQINQFNSFFASNNNNQFNNNNMPNFSNNNFGSMNNFNNNIKINFDFNMWNNNNNNNNNQIQQLISNQNNLNCNNNSNNNKDMKKKYLFEIFQFKEPPLIGLENIGATCYMNATLQCLSNINMLTGFFLYNKKYFTNIPFQSPEKPISKAFSEVIYHLWNPYEPNKYYSPHYFKEVISSKNKLFSGIQANDSKDLFLFLLENIHKELNTLKDNQIVDDELSDQKNAEYELMKCLQNYYKVNKSIITDVFYFDQANITKCLNCGTSLYNFGMHNLLIFPLEKTRIYKEQKERNFENVNIKDCFDCHTNPECSQPGDIIYCNSCKTESKYILENKLSSFPEILTIMLNRGIHLEFDVNFLITHILEDMDDYLIKLNCNKQYLGTRYELIGMIFHVGNSGMDGHFFTYCKSPVNKKWYWFNDAMVERIQDPTQENRGIPYLLFYQKIKK